MFDLNTHGTNKRRGRGTSISVVASDLSQQRAPERTFAEINRRGLAPSSRNLTVYFWWENIKVVAESSDEKALKFMKLVTVMVWCWCRMVHLPALLRHSPLSALFPLHAICTCSPGRHARVACAQGSCETRMVDHLYALGTSRHVLRGEESLAEGISRNASPADKRQNKRAW